MGNYVNDQNFGFEIGYTDFGSVKRAGDTTKVDGIKLSLIGRAPLLGQECAAVDAPLGDRSRSALKNAGSP